MNLEAEIRKEHSKRQTVKIAKWVGSDPTRFSQLIELFLHGDRLVTQRSVWIAGHCADACPKLIEPWLPAIVKKMEEPDVHEAVPRNILRILQYRDVPRDLLGKVVTLCFNYLGSLDTPIAVKANAMTVLEHAARKEPDLQRELELVIRHMLPYGGPAIRARGRQVLRNLSRRTGKKITNPGKRQPGFI